MDNIKTEVIQASRDFDAIYKPLFGDMKFRTVDQLKKQYIQSLTGYNVEKNKYKLVETIDPVELNHFNNNLKRDLGQNKDFYLYGDRNFLS